MEREITEPTRQCGPDGRLSPDAVGWARRPLIESNLPRSWGRRKRWHHWAVVAGDHVLTATIADLDYLALGAALHVDLARGSETEAVSALPLGAGIRLPDSVFGVARLRGPGLGLDFDARPGRVTLAVRGRLSAEVEIDWPEGHETLAVVVPWSPTRHQHTVKANALPARGQLSTPRGRFALDGWATLDYGRGLWPYRTSWNWASASGRAGAHVVGFNLGGQCTDGTGVTENALTVDGRLTKYGEQLEFAYDRRDFRRPWRITAPSRRVDLSFTPRHHKRVRVPLGLLSTSLDLCFGDFRGRLVDAGGHAHEIALTGWAEEHRARW